LLHVEVIEYGTKVTPGGGCRASLFQ